MPKSSFAYFNEQKRIWAHTEGDQSLFTDAATGRLLFSIPVEPQRARQVHFSPDGNFAVTNEGLSAIKLIDVERGRLLTTLRSRTQEGSSSYASNSDASQLAVAGFRDVHLWRLDTLEQDLRELDLCWDDE